MPGPSGTTPVLELPYPIPGDTVDVPRDIQALAEKLDPVGTVPVGAVTMWMTNVPPDGWLLLTGQTVSAATYPGLAGIFGQAGGNVTLPDLAGRFPVGASTGDMALNEKGGANSVGLAAGHLPAHTHNGGGTTGDDSPDHSHGFGPLPDTFISAVAGIDQITASGNNSAQTTGANARHRHSFSFTTDGGAGLNGTAHENRPLYLAVNFIIRAG